MAYNVQVFAILLRRTGGRIFCAPSRDTEGDFVLGLKIQFVADRIPSSLLLLMLATVFFNAMLCQAKFFVGIDCSDNSQNVYASSKKAMI